MVITDDDTARHVNGRGGHQDVVSFTTCTIATAITQPLQTTPGKNRLGFGIVYPFNAEAIFELNLLPANVLDNNEYAKNAARSLVPSKTFWSHPRKICDTGERTLTS